MATPKRKDRPAAAFQPAKKQKTSDSKATNPNNGHKQFKLDASSAEAHAKQRALAKERKAAKPNADAIQRSKKLWEKLRIKSQVQKEERKELVAELFSLIDGRVRDFVFKHDSVRVIQCAIKYSRREQLKSIVQELKTDVRELAESKYGKFLVAKMVVQGDQEDRDTIIPQFYGHVKRLINHPEASWIVDDIYRQVATPTQKAMMLREWYGAEFALFHRNNANASDGDVTADLKAILDKSPEKRRPILQYLLQMINNLIQKKMTGFTMLHDAMLQYFLALNPGSEEHTEFLEILKGDIDTEEEGGGGDLYRNLAFTKSGSRLVCLALAYGSAKDRKTILRCYKDNIEAMALDQHAKMVLAVGLDVPDDTRMIYQSILRELLGLQAGEKAKDGASQEDNTHRHDRLEGMITDLNARLPILYPLAGMAKWLVKDNEKVLLEEINEIRNKTSKKAPDTRRRELAAFMSDPLLGFVSERTANLGRFSITCQAMTEILLECNGEHRDAAKVAVTQLAKGDPLEDGHAANEPAVGRMLRTLIVGGNFDPVSKEVKLVEPRLGFGEVLFPMIKEHMVEWACSASSFVAVAMLESNDLTDTIKKEAKSLLKKGKKRIQAAALGTEGSEEGGNKKANVGAKILLEHL